MKLGIMLYSVRDLLERDFVGTLKKIAFHGFDTVELIGLTSHPLMNDPLFGYSADDIGRILKDHGLQAVSSHTNPMQDIGPQLDVAQQLGLDYLVVPMAPEFLLMGPNGPGFRKDTSDEDCLAIADRLNMHGKQCQQKGIKLAYHNHHIELFGPPKKTPYDLILDNTDPELVSMELDVGWVVKAGFDPVELLNKYPGRFSLCHLKDIDPDRPETGMGEEFVAPGDGTLKFDEIISGLEHAGVNYGFIECDHPEDSEDLLVKAGRLLN